MFFAAAAMAGCLAASMPAARAQSGVLLNHSEANFASHDGNTAFLGLGVALPLFIDGSAGKNHALRAADALGVSTLLSEGMKLAVREKRPDSNERDSFPSGHATAAFAIATMESHFHRQAAPLWYLGAFFIADSRLTLRRHYLQDVIAGAALGTGVALWETSMPRGLILSPFISRDRSAASGSNAKAATTRGVSFALQF